MGPTIALLSAPSRLAALRPGGSRVLLELDLTEPPLPDEPTDPLGRLRARHRTPLPQLVAALRDAAADPGVAGLVARLGGPALGLAAAQEVAEAVREFRAQGKPAVAWSETFGEFAAATSSYVLATAFDTVWLQQSGGVGLVGFALTTPFLGDALRRAGVEPQLGQRHEYKNAADVLMRGGFTAAHREAVTRLVESSWEQARAAVAAGRGLPVETVQRLADAGPTAAEEALREGLVDRVGYRDEVLADVRRRVGGSGESPPLLLLSRYRRRPGPAEVARRLPGRRRRVVALVSLVGAIHQGRSRRGPVGAPSAGSDTVSAALRSAARDPQVGAVVLRVDSPGGSYVASDAIAREVALLRDGGTPVVVSMGSVAASGGYFVAAPADRVLALPGTLTGSIGVLAGKLVTRGLTDRVGVHPEVVTAGDAAAMLTTTRPFTDDEIARLDAWLDDVYDDFVDQVARGRGLTRFEVEAVARGRVWTGADALERGLVDELGGLGAAVAAARGLAGLPGDAQMRRWPHVTPLDRLRPPRSSEDPAAVRARLDPWSGFGALAGVLGLPAAGPLALPPLGW